MKRALRTLFHVVVLITCFDIIAWASDHYWRQIGERKMKKAHTAELTEYYTKRIMDIWSKAIAAYMKKNRKAPKNLLDAVKDSFDRTTDMWDNELKLKKEEDVVFVVSAGADGEFETEDDLKCEVGRSMFEESERD